MKMETICDEEEENFIHKQNQIKGISKKYSIGRKKKINGSNEFV
jgi:hypothetical protein